MFTMCDILAHTQTRTTHISCYIILCLQDAVTFLGVIALTGYLEMG